MGVDPGAKPSVPSPGMGAIPLPPEPDRIAALPLGLQTRRVDGQAKATLTVGRRRIAAPTSPKPAIISAQVDGSGTAVCADA